MLLYFFTGSISVRLSKENTGAVVLTHQHADKQRGHAVPLLVLYRCARLSIVNFEPLCRAWNRCKYIQVYFSYGCILPAICDLQAETKTTDGGL